MGKRIVKYNPAFLSKEQLVHSFVVRHAELGLITQVLRENVAKSNQHVLVIGPRGIGKTMLVLRAVEEVRKEQDLNDFWYPLVFSEESYRVTTSGEFWLEALFHLGQQRGDAHWKQTYGELSNEQDEDRLRERALGQLMDFADSQGKHILLVVENFNMLLGEQMNDKDGWTLRHTLLNEPRVMLLATATSRFEAIDNCDKPMFELFRTLELKPLEEEDCRTLWASITGKEPDDKRVRPIQILTGGNPRLLSIISGFASRLSLKELMADLMQLVDEHTEYFKSHLDGLPPIERKVYLGLAELWDPATARQVADATRLNVSKTSSLLRRLMERGAVVLSDGQKRTKMYQVAERMYNIYYLMRRRGTPSRRVRALVNFLVGFYGQEELVKLTQRIAEEACDLDAALRQDHYFAFEGIIQRVSSNGIRELIIKSVPKDFFDLPDTPTSIRKFADVKSFQNVLALFQQLKELIDKNEGQKAKDLCNKAIESAPDTAIGWVIKGGFLPIIGHIDEAETAFRKAIELDRKSVIAWFSLGLLMHTILDRYHEAEEAYRRAIELDEKFMITWAYYGLLLHEKLNRFEESEKSYRRAIELGDQSAWTWTNLGRLLHEKLGRYDEAEKAYRKAIELEEGKNELTWIRLGMLLHEKLERYDEAEKVYRKAIELGDGKNELAWTQLGLLLHDKLGRSLESEKAYRKAIELNEKFALPWAYLGLLLQEKPEHYDEAEKAFRKVVELDPSAGSWAWLLIGQLCLMNPERHEEAKEALRKAMEFDSVAPTVMKLLVILVLNQEEAPEEALEILKNCLIKPRSIEQNIDVTTESVIELAAYGYGKEVLEIVRESPSAKVLEPLVVGLRLFVGEDVKVAAEIMEVAKDVAKRIEQRRVKIQKEATESKAIK